MNKIKQIIKKQGFTSKVLGFRFYVLGEKNKANAFTLVELIIVIAIIAVLAVAAFMMLTKWLGKSRDSRRLGDLGTIARGLQVGYSDTDDGVNMYPTVKDQTGSIVIWSGTDTVVGYQGVVDNEVVVGASIQKAPMDPSDGSYYTYLVTQNRQKFQILAFLEDGTEVSTLNDAYALEYANMTPTTKGFELGVILRQSDNMPANLIGGGLTGVDLSTATVYKAIVNDNTIKEGTDVKTAPIINEDVIEESVEPEPTPQELCEAKTGYSWDGTNCNYDYLVSCKAIFDSGNHTTGVHYIDPDGAETGVDPFQVYCEMDMDGGGWTLLANVYRNYYTTDLPDYYFYVGLNQSKVLSPDSVSGEAGGYLGANKFTNNFPFTMAKLDFIAGDDVNQRAVFYKTITKNNVFQWFNGTTGAETDATKICTDLSMTQNCTTRGFDHDYNNDGVSNSGVIMFWGTELGKYGYTYITHYPFHTANNLIDLCSATSGYDSNAWNDSYRDGHWGNGLLIWFR